MKKEDQQTKTTKQTFLKAVNFTPREAAQMKRDAQKECNGKGLRHFER